MATKPSKRPAKRALGTLSLENFMMRDFRTIKLSCERFLKPEVVKRGAYSLKATVKAAFPDHEKGDTGLVTITFQFAVDGNTTIEKNGKSVEGPKSLSIVLDGEATFDIVGRKSAPPSLVTKELVSGLLAQVHPVAVKRIRDCAYEMGFRGFRPALGMDQLAANVEKLSR